MILFLFFFQNQDIYTTSINEMNWTELPMHEDLKQIQKLSSVMVAGFNLFPSFSFLHVNFILWNSSNYRKLWKTWIGCTYFLQKHTDVEKYLEIYINSFE